MKEELNGDPDRYVRPRLIANGISVDLPDVEEGATMSFSLFGLKGWQATVNGALRELTTDKLGMLKLDLRPMTVKGHYSGGSPPLWTFLFSILGIMIFAAAWFGFWRLRKFHE